MGLAYSILNSILKIIDMSDSGKTDEAFEMLACVGILVADVIVEPVSSYPEKGVLVPVNSITMHNGGNAMTATINLKKLGVDSYIFGMVGDDVFGDFLKGKLRDAGAFVSGLKTNDKVQTSASVLMIDERGERSFFHCTGTNAVFSEKDIDYSVIENCDMIFVTGTFLLDSFDGEDTMKFLKKCKEMGKTTFLDVCWDAKGKWSELLDMSMPYIDFFMPSIDEAIQLTGKEDTEEIADVFIKKGARNIIIKLGSKGSYLRAEGETKGKIFSPFYVENPVDTTGAGDSFCSGFLSAFARGASLDECMVFGNAVGAECVTEKGATTGIKTYEETIEFIEKEQKKCL